MMAPAMAFQRLWQMITQCGASYVEAVPFFYQYLADAAGRGTFLMQDD